MFHPPTHLSNDTPVGHVDISLLTDELMPEMEDRVASLAILTSVRLEGREACESGQGGFSG